MKSRCRTNFKLPDDNFYGFDETLFSSTFVETNSVLDLYKLFWNNSNGFEIIFFSKNQDKKLSLVKKIAFHTAPVFFAEYFDTIIL